MVEVNSSLLAQIICVYLSWMSCYKHDVGTGALDMTLMLQ